jgi:hypothetical protein
LTRGLAGDNVSDMAFQLAVLTLFLLLLGGQAPSLAAEVAPRITDREVVERLTRLEEGQKRLEEGQRALHKRIDDLRSEMNGRFDSINGRFDSINGRFDSINGRFDTLQWTLGLFITISLVILGFVLRLQWQLARRQTQVEATL